MQVKQCLGLNTAESRAKFWQKNIYQSPPIRFSSSEAIVVNLFFVVASIGCVFVCRVLVLRCGLCCPF